MLRTLLAPSEGAGEGAGQKRFVRKGIRKVGVPVALTLRFILRLPLLSQLELKELLLQLMLKHAVMCAGD